MTKYLPAIITGFAVIVLIAFGLGSLATAAGHPVGLSTWLPAVIFGTLVGYVMANLVGTKRAKGATADEKAAALTLRPEPGQAQLIVFREGFVGMAAGLNVLLDDRPIAQLKSPRFTALSMTPGPHTVSATFVGLAAAQNRPAEQTFVAQPDEVIAFRLTLSMGAAKNTIHIERIDYPPALAAKLDRMTMVVAQA